MKKRTARSAVLLLALAGPAFAQEQGSELDLFKLDDLLKSQTQVASHEERTVLETPGVVTILSREEILASGGRDLMDVLALVPGFWFGVDNQGVTDVGFRGMWAHEGKMLLMVDGVPMNENAFGTNQLGHRYPLELIQQIEIIRGPGSAIYGGSAELCVVNLVTRSAAQLHGSAVGLYASRMGNTLGQGDVSVASGAENVADVEGLNIAASASVGRGTRSTNNYTDFSGNTYNLTRNSELNPTFVDLGIQWKNLNVRVVYDDYQMLERDSLTTVLPYNANQRFTSFSTDARYDFNLGPVTLTPRLSYAYQQPWDVPNPVLPDYQDLAVSRVTARLTATWRPFQPLSLLLGTDNYHETASFNRPDEALPGYLFGAKHDQTSISYLNLGGFAELQYSSILGELTLGARLEHHNVVGTSFVPRAAFTKVVGPFSAKLLFSEAFRPPSIENFNIAPPEGVRPERTQDAEVEVGYRVTEHAFLSANAFDVTTRDVLVYSTAADLTQAYHNLPRTGTEGAEVQAKVVYFWGFINANYSYYTAWSVFLDAVKNQAPAFAVPGNNSVLAGFPAHKIAANGKVKVWRDLSLLPGFIFLSPRYGQTGQTTYGRQGALGLVNMFVAYEGLLSKHLDVSIGVYNLLNSSYGFFQPYSSGHAALPGPTRDFVARLSTTF